MSKRTPTTGADTATATPPAPTAGATPSEPKKNKGANKDTMDDLIDVSIDEFTPAVVRWLLDLVPKDQYETIFQDKAKYWNLVLPLFNFFLRRAFNAPEMVDDFTTNFFAEVRREINIRAGREGGGGQTGKASNSTFQAGGLLRLFLKSPWNLESYERIVAEKNKKEVKKIEDFLNSLAPDELIAFFATDDLRRRLILASFITKDKKTKSFSKALAELGKKIKKFRDTTSWFDITEPINAAGDKAADLISDNITKSHTRRVEERKNRPWLKKLLW